MTNPAAADLIARSNRLGADPKNTNYAGGNTSAKGTDTDPVTGEPEELLAKLTAAEAETAGLRNQLKAILAEALAR